jgi:hypothetical protein
MSGSAAQTVRSPSERLYAALVRRSVLRADKKPREA